MTRICLFNTVTFWGGGEKYYLELAIALKEMGHEIILVCAPDSPLSEKAKEQGVPTYELLVGRLSFLNPIKRASLTRFFRDRQTEALLFSTSQDLKIAALSAKAAGVKRIIYRRGMAVPLKNRWLNRFLFRHVVTEFLANSQETKRSMLLNLGHIIPEDKIRVIHNGIDISETEEIDSKTNTTIKSTGSGIILGNAGRLDATKGHRTLIEVADRLRNQGADFTLFIAGKGEMEEEIKRWIAERHLENHIILLGFQDDMKAFMNSIDIFVFPTESEGFGFVLIEAMLFARPVVGWNKASLPEIVVDGETGYLVEFPRLDEFAERINELISNSELKVRMGNNGRKRVIESFNLSTKLKDTADFLTGKVI